MAYKSQHIYLKKDCIVKFYQRCPWEPRGLKPHISILTLQQRQQVFSGSSQNVSETKMGSQSKPRAIIKDRISRLPEPVLCHILSLIPTKYAVRTSVLSKRWKKLWAFVPNIDLDDKHEHFSERNRDRNDYVHFAMFVDRVLSLHEMDIHMFRLHCSIVEDFAPIEGWIRSAIGCNAVEFDLRIESFRNKIFQLPHSVFKYKKLLVEKLFSCCPVLEDLTIDGVVRYDVLNFKISAPELKTLRIRLRLGALGIDGNNFSVNAPKLEKLDVTKVIFSNYNLESSKSIVNLYLIGGSPLLARISKVKNMYLSAFLLKGCSLPAFGNLKELKLVVRNHYHWELLTELLKRSPKLEHLVIEHEHELCCTTFSDDEEEVEEYSTVYLGPQWNTPETVPICVSSHLKTITIRGFGGGYDEMEVTKYLLENGKVPNKMDMVKAIKVADCSLENDQVKFKEAKALIALDDSLAG
ncbi:unnamed protein product [Malus baccata var. baccata]